MSVAVRRCSPYITQASALCITWLMEAFTSASWFQHYKCGQMWANLNVCKITLIKSFCPYFKTTLQ